MATLELSFTKGALDKAVHTGGAATRYRDTRYPNLYIEVGARSTTWRYRKILEGSERHRDPRDVAADGRDRSGPDSG